MIKASGRFFNNAHRLSFPAAAALTTFYDGQWLALNSSGEAILSTGAANVKSYMTLSSRYGVVGGGIGAPITEAPAGRDTVTSTGMVSVLIGTFAVETDQWETGTYNLGAALKVSANGKLMPWVNGTDNAALIVGYVTKAPAGATDTLGMVSA